MIGAYESVLNLANDWPDTETVARFNCLPGRFAVKMCPPREKHGSLYLPDVAAGRGRPDAGTVVNAGAGVPLEVGQRGYVRPYVGAYVEDGKHWVRIFGIESDFEGVDRIPWWDHFVAEDRDGEPYPTGRNLMVERERRTAVIELLESYTQLATIVRAGADCQLKPGTRVALRPDADELTFAYGDTGKALCLVSEDDVLVVIE